MDIYSINPIHLEQETYITKTTITQDNDDFLHISFTDDTDDCFSPKQTIKIHRNDFDEFVQMLNRAVNLL